MTKTLAYSRLQSRTETSLNEAWAKALKMFRGHVGGRVSYRDPFFDGPKQWGVITSVSEKWVFVRYSRTTQAVPTCPLNLSLAR